PAVLMSDSMLHDRTRRRGYESIKRRVVRLFGSALVAGARHRDYACALGLSADAVFDGYDVVDNAHFERGANEARRLAGQWRERFGLPERFFLASARFVPEKNLLRLLDAFAVYRRRAGPDAWDLVLLGDGALRPAIERRIGRADLAGHVVLPGFRQYDELPAFYGLAGAFVHASTTEQWGLVVNEARAAGLPVLVSGRGGCVPDLVRGGESGFTFAPFEVEKLAGRLQRIAAMSDGQRRALGGAGRRIIAAWEPERFADGLMRAVEVARARPPRPAWFDEMLLQALVHRPL